MHIYILNIFNICSRFQFNATARITLSKAREIIHLFLNGLYYNIIRLQNDLFEQPRVPYVVPPRLNEKKTVYNNNNKNDEKRLPPQRLDEISRPRAVITLSSCTRSAIDT